MGPERTRPREDIADRLIAAGLAHNRALLAIDGCLRSDTPPGGTWGRPSRAFTYPIATERKGFDGTVTGLYARHPLLLHHPFVRRVVDELGFEVRMTDDSRPDCALATWHHAVDLATDRHAEALLATRDFSTDDRIMDAVAFQLGCRIHGEGRGGNRFRLTPPTARRILTEIAGEEEPLRSAAFRHALARDGGGRPFPACNLRGDPKRKAWAMIHGIEDRWIRPDRGGHLEVAPSAEAPRQARGRPNSGSATMDISAAA